MMEDGNGSVAYFSKGRLSSYVLVASVILCVF